MKSLGARWMIRCPRRGAPAPAFLQIDQCIQLQHLGGMFINSTHFKKFCRTQYPSTKRNESNTKCPTGASQAVLEVKNPPTNAGDIRDMDSVLESRRSPVGGHGNPLQYSRLETSMDRGAWQATVHGVKKSWMQLSTT